MHPCNVTHTHPRTGAPSLADYLIATGWAKTKEVKAGTVCIVDGQDGSQIVPYGHAVIGVGHGIVDAHNNAHYHVPITNYNPNICLDPPSNPTVFLYLSQTTRNSLSIDL